jgi:hypothetical protein
MNTLSEKSRVNLRILKNLGEHEILSSSSLREFSIQEEFVEVDNIREIENGIYFTFHQCLSDIVNMCFVEKDVIIKDIDEAIQNIYDNKKLNTLLEDDTELYKIMDDIDIKHDMLKEAYFYKSPFYNYYCKYCGFKDYLKDITQNPPVFTYFATFLREYRKFDDRMKGVYYSSDDYTSSEEEENDIITGCDNKEE